MGSGGTTALLPPDKFFSNLPNFNLKSGADTQSRTGDLTLTKGALYQLSHISTLNLMPGSSLLSHGETPHYHRRYGVSLLSSAWGQVGPPRYGRQANSVLSTRPVMTCRFNLLSSLLIDVSSAKTSLFTLETWYSFFVLRRQESVSSSAHTDCLINC